MLNKTNLENPVFGEVGFVGEPHEHCSKGIRISQLCHSVWLNTVLKDLYVSSNSRHVFLVLREFVTKKNTISSLGN